MLGSAESERPRPTDSEIIFEEFQPMSSQSINVTDGRTDRRHAIARLCTVVHRAVKTTSRGLVQVLVTVIRTRNVANFTKCNCIFTVSIRYSERDRTVEPW